jgi:hypothetical protein
MNVLDENVREDQRTILRQWGIPFRQVGKELSNLGAQDDVIIALLHRLKHPTFFTGDEDFFKLRLRHRDYGLVWLNVRSVEAAMFIRRFLRQPSFRTQRQRLGKVARVSVDCVRYWQTGNPELVRVDWV